MLLNAEFLKKKYDQAVSYDEFVAMGEPMGHRGNWDMRYGQLELSPEQHETVSSMTRTMHILSLTGTWCGDCALQGAALHRIAESNPDRIQLRFLMREDAHADLIVPAQLNAGFRVPMTWFMAEDFEPCSVIGDRPLSRYRSMARKALGAQSNVHAPAPEDPVRTVLGELLEEVERVHLLLRLSGRLREKHGD